MNDTSDEARKKQLEIILRKTPAERIEMALEMMENVRELVIAAIRKQHPGISEPELKIEFIKRYYQNDLTPEHLEDVFAWIRKKYV